MAGYIFLGRQRHPLKILLFQLLTLGIYGRVYLYKILREFDGHEALFLDRRPYIPLLILPFVGPLLVKQKVTAIATDLIHHDVTTPKFKPGRLRLLAWIPLVPLFHMELQRVLNHHWGMHRKELELELKRAQLASLQRSRTPEAAKAAQVLSKEIAQREKELDDVRQASLALREAEQVRLEAERAAGHRASPMALVRKLSAAATARLPRRGAAETAETEEAAEAIPETAEPEATGKGKGAAPEPEAEPEPEPEAPEEPPIEEEAVEASEPEEAPKPKKPKAEPVEEPAAAKKGWTSFVPFLGKKKDKQPAEPEPKKEKKGAAKADEKKPVEKEPKKEKKGGAFSFLPFLGKKSEKKPEKPAKGGTKASGKGEKLEPSRAERKALKQKEKEKAKAAKQAAKEKKKAEKAAAKEAKNAEKAAAKEAKAKAKAEKKAAKQQAKAEAAAAKEKEKAAAKKKGKATDKKEKSGVGAAGKSKGAKPKSRSK